MHPFEVKQEEKIGNGAYERDSTICNPDKTRRERMRLKTREREGEHIEDFQPEWCISSRIYSRDTPFWS